MNPCKGWSPASNMISGCAKPTKCSKLSSIMTMFTNQKNDLVSSCRQKRKGAEETKEIQSGFAAWRVRYTSFSMKLRSTVVIALPEYFSSVSLSTCAAIIGALFACWASARSLNMSIISCLTSTRVEPSTFGRQICSFFTTTIGSERPPLRRKFHLQGGFLVLWQIRKFCTFSNKIYMKWVSNI